MNKVYRRVWNALLGTWGCAAETAHARGKGSSGLVPVRRGLMTPCPQASRRTVALRLAALPFALMNLDGLAHAAQPPPALMALPAGWQILAGQAPLRQTGLSAFAISCNAIQPHAPPSHLSSDPPERSP